MADYNKNLASVSIPTTTTATNALATVTVAAPGARRTIACTKILVSFSAAPATAIVATVKSGATTLFTINIPAAVSDLLQIDFGSHPITAAELEALVLTVPAAGAGVVCSATLFTFVTAAG